MATKHGRVTKLPAIIQNLYVRLKMATNLDLDATGDATTWIFFIFAENLLDRCEHSARIINLEFHAAALLFNCLDRVLSVLRSVLHQS